MYVHWMREWEKGMGDVFSLLQEHEKQIVSCYAAWEWVCVSLTFFTLTHQQSNQMVDLEFLQIKSKRGNEKLPIYLQIISRLLTASDAYACPKSQLVRCLSHTLTHRETSSLLWEGCVSACVCFCHPDPHLLPFSRHHDYRPTAGTSSHVSNYSPRYIRRHDDDDDPHPILMKDGLLFSPTFSHNLCVHRVLRHWVNTLCG